MWYDYDDEHCLCEDNEEHPTESEKLLGVAVAEISVELHVGRFHYSNSHGGDQSVYHIVEYCGINYDPSDVGFSDLKIGGESGQDRRRRVGEYESQSDEKMII